MTKIGDLIRRVLRRIPRLPRKWRVVRNLACTLLLTAVFIIPQLNLYPRTLNGAFRRQCKSNLLGEPEIIWQDSAGADGEGEKAFLVADGGDRYYYAVFQNLGISGWRGSMVPWEKEGGLTFMPFEIFCDSQSDIALQLLLLHDVEGAQYAQVDIPLELKVYYGYDGAEADAEFSQTRTVGLGLHSDGIMHGLLYPQSPYYADPKENIEGAALRAAEVGATERLTWGGHKFPITIRLYSSNGTLLREESLIYSFPQ